MPISRYWRRAYTQDRLIHKTGLYTRQAYMTCTIPRQGLYAPSSYTLEGASHAGLVHFSAIPVQKALAGTVLCTSRAYARDTSRVLCTTVPYPCKRRFPVRFRVLTGLTHATLRADCGSCVLARLMHATGLCATGGCRIQASTRDRLLHKSGLCTRHYGNDLFRIALVCSVQRKSCWKVMPRWRCLRATDSSFPSK